MIQTRYIFKVVFSDRFTDGEQLDSRIFWKKDSAVAYAEELLNELRGNANVALLREEADDDGRFHTIARCWHKGKEE